jgi:hypothetical protein
MHVENDVQHRHVVGCREGVAGWPVPIIPRGTVHPNSEPGLWISTKRHLSRAAVVMTEFDSTSLLGARLLFGGLLRLMMEMNGSVRRQILHVIDHSALNLNRFRNGVVILVDLELRPCFFHVDFITTKVWVTDHQRL